MVFGRINAFEPKDGICPRCHHWLFDHNWNGEEHVCPYCGYVIREGRK